MKKNSHKGIKKLVSFALALAVAASLLPAAALPAEASEQAAPVETSAAPTEVSGYLDNETPEQLVSLLRKLFILETTERPTETRGFFWNISRKAACLLFRRCRFP